MMERKPLGRHGEQKRPTIPPPTGPRVTPPHFDGVEDETERRKKKPRVIRDMTAQPAAAADALEKGGKDGLADNTTGKAQKILGPGRRS